MWLRRRRQLPCVSTMPWVLEKGTKEQNLIFCCALWVIWNSRNQLVHERKHLSGRILAQKIESYIAELEGVGKEKHAWGTDRLQKHSEEEPEDTILFDAAFEANRSRSASGVIARNSRGEMKVLKQSLHSNVSSPFLAEALACLQAVKLGISLGLRSATIRGDSKTVIKKCQSAERDKSSIGVVINDIKNHSFLFHEVSFQFIQKSENYQAHEIAKETLATENERYLVRDELFHNEGVTVEEWPRNPD